MRILVAEDDPILRVIVTQTLRKLGHGVVAAADGEEAWTHLQQEPLRIVVSDWMMPRLDGLALCRRIRADAGREYVYFIVLTVQDATEVNRRVAADAGVDDFLTKPLNPTDLWLRLRVAERIIACSTRVRELERLLPICSYCRKVRDDRDYWQQIENYLREQVGSRFSHSVCPDCYERTVVPRLRAAGLNAPPYPSAPER